MQTAGVKTSNRLLCLLAPWQGRFSCGFCCEGRDVYRGQAGGVA